MSIEEEKERLSEIANRKSAALVTAATQLVMINCSFRYRV